MFLCQSITQKHLEKTFLLVTPDTKSGDVDTMDICTRLNDSPSITVILRITTISYFTDTYQGSSLLTSFPPLFPFSVIPECDMLPANQILLPTQLIGVMQRCRVLEQSPWAMARVKYECLANPDEMLESPVTQRAVPAAIYHPALPYLL